MVEKRPSLLARYNQFLDKVTARSALTAPEQIASLRLFVTFITLAIFAGISAVIFYFTFFALTGITQAVYAGIFLIIAILIALIAFAFARSGRLRLATLTLMSAVLLAYGSLAFLFSGVFYFSLIGGGVLIALAILLTIPDEWYWGWPFLLLLAGSAWLADQITGLERFNAQGSPPLWGFIIGVTALVVILGFIMLLRAISTGNIQTQFVIIVAIAAIMPTAITGVINNLFAQRALTQAAEQSLLSTATQTATAVDTFLTTNLRLVSAHAGLSDLVNYLKLPPEARSSAPETSRVRRLLLQLARLDVNYIASYAVLDRNGINVIDTIFSDIGRDESDASYFQTPLRTGQPYVSDFLLGLGPRTLEVYFSAPIRDVGNQIIGVLRVRYNAGIIQQIVYQNSKELGPGSAPILLDEHLVRLADGTENNLVLSPLIPLGAEVLETLKAARRLPASADLSSSTNLSALAQGLARYTEDPVFAAEAHASKADMDLVAVAAISTKPWLVVITQPQAEFLRPVATQGRIAMVVGVLSVVAILAITAWRSQVFSQPIIDLTRAAERMMAGELDTAVTINSQDEIGILANSFNSMAAQVQELVTTLEQRVQARTAALATSAAVGRQIATILNEDELVRAVVQEIQSAFNYYHVHIYLLDPKGEKLLMAGGTGEAGRIMLARGHHIPLGRGLVGRAAATGQVYLAPDTHQEPEWLPNPLLPETRAEVAVPIVYSDTVLGVLDVQQDVVNSLNENDVDLLQSIATQVAISLRNARLYAEIQKQASREAQIYATDEMIMQTTSVEEAMQVAIRELGRALNSSYVRIQLQTEEGNGIGHDGRHLS